MFVLFCDAGNLATMFCVLWQPRSVSYTPRQNCGFQSAKPLKSNTDQTSQPVIATVVLLFRFVLDIFEFDFVRALCSPTVGLIRDMSFCLMLSPSRRVCVRSRPEDSENARHNGAIRFRVSGAKSTHHKRPQSARGWAVKPKKPSCSFRRTLPKLAPASRKRRVVVRLVYYLGGL